MALLKKEDLLKRGNYDTFVKKFLGLNGKENKFLTKEGIFVPIALVLDINGKQYAYETKEIKSLKEILSRVEEASSTKGTKSSIELTGKYENTGRITTVKVTDLEKTGEFGGQGAGSGKKENLGLVFEREFYDSLVNILNCEGKKGKYHDQAKKLVENLGKEYKSPLKEVIAVGELNQKRPLKVSKGNLSIGSGQENIGQTVTDITLKFGNKEAFLSLKFQSTLAFANIGIQSIFTEKSVNDYNLNDTAKNILEVFGLDETDFCSTFNNYPHSKQIANYKQDVTNICDRGAITKLLRQMMGYGYVMVHGKGANKVDIYEVDMQYLNKSANLVGSITAYYGGTTGTGKKVIVDCSSALYNFQFNFRNKAGKLYPSHIMCDYKKK
jgi:archaellin